MKEANIKTIIPVGAQEYFAAYLPDRKNSIEPRIEGIVCWSLISFASDSPDEVVGQIIIKDQVVEVTYPDGEDGFGEFLGYFKSIEEAGAAIFSARNKKDADDEDDDEDEEDEDGDEEDGEEDDEEADEEEGEGEDLDDDEAEEGEDEDEDGDEDDEEDEDEDEEDEAPGRN